MQSPIQLQELGSAIARITARSSNLSVNLGDGGGLLFARPQVGIEEGYWTARAFGALSDVTMPMRHVVGLPSEFVPNGLQMFERRALNYQMDNDFDTANAKSKATMRFSVGWSDAHGVYGSEGA